MRDGWQRVMDEIAELRDLKGHQTGEGSFLMLVGKIARLVEEESELAYMSGRDAERRLVYKEFAEWQAKKFACFKTYLTDRHIAYGADDDGEGILIELPRIADKHAILLNALQYDLMADSYVSGVHVWTREYVM